MSSSWEKQELPNRAAPFTLRLSLACISGVCDGTFSGWSVESPWGFHYSQRSREASDIHAKDICLDPSASHGVLHLGFTKIWTAPRRRGSCAIDGYLVASLLPVWKTTSLPGDKLVPSPGRSRKTFIDSSCSSSSYSSSSSSISNKNMLAKLGMKDVGCSAPPANGAR